MEALRVYFWVVGSKEWSMIHVSELTRVLNSMYVMVSVIYWF